MELLKLLLIPIASYLYRQRGNPISKIPKAVALVLFGAAIAAACLPWVEASLIPAAVITAAFALGCSIGHGNAIGPALHNGKPDLNAGEWWQKGPLLDNSWLALLVLGVLRSVLCLGLFYFDSSIGMYLVAASAVSTPLAVWLAVRVTGGWAVWVRSDDPTWAFEDRRSHKMWRNQEFIYGALMCTSATAIGWA